MSSSGSIDHVRLYLDDISRHAILTPAEERRLAQALDAEQEVLADEQFKAAVCVNGLFYISGHPGSAPIDISSQLNVLNYADQSRERFITANLRLVVSIAKKYAYNERSLLDLAQDGTIGLMHAVDKFDWRKGFRFSTYATWWIRHAIEREMPKNFYTVRPPYDTAELIDRIGRARNALAGQLGRVSTAADVAEYLDVAVKSVEAVDRDMHIFTPVHIEEPIDSDKQLTLGDRLQRDGGEGYRNDLERQRLKNELLTLLTNACLTSLEEKVLIDCYGLVSGEPRLARDVGNELNMSRQEIKRVRARALYKLRSQKNIIELARINGLKAHKRIPATQIKS